MSTEKKFESKDFSDEELVSASTETIGSSPSQKSLWAQAELTRRLTQTLRQLDESTTRYSRAMLALTLVVLVIALFQLAAAIITPPTDTRLQLLVFVIAAGFIGWAFWKIVKDLLE